MSTASSAERVTDARRKEDGSMWTISHRARCLLVTLSSAFAFLLCACGAGGSGMSSNVTSQATPSTTSSCDASNCAPAMVTMTDAQGDFLSYIVTLTSLRLQTAGGASVETLPATTKVDFAQLVDLTEIVSAAQIPTAQYVGATLTLDYAGASITADNGSGTPVPLTPVDANGNPLTGTVTVSVQLDNTHPLMVTAGRIGRLALDFNLAASNTANLSAGTVTVSPTLVATVVPSDTKPIRVRGQFASASAAKSDFVLDVQPFYDMTGNGGQVTVNVTAATTYQINGTAYVGTPGLTALAALPADTLVAAFGSLQTGTETFSATSVLAGTSLQSRTQDEISGTVIARSGTTLTVHGAIWGRPDGDFDFERENATVTVGPNTSVTMQGMMGSFSVTDISVGQHIDAFGAASQTSEGSLALDATAGQVRLDLTPAWGLVTGLATGSLTVQLQSLDGLPASDFNFAGTGGGTSADAQAASYVINTSSLSQSGLAVNQPARVFGFVTAFGAAPPDFTAQTLVNYSAVPEALVVDWGWQGSATALTGLTATSSALQLNLADVGARHFVQIGPEQLDLTKLAAAPRIAPDTAATNTVFTIGHTANFPTENFSSFADFVAELAKEVMPGTTVIAVSAAGQYDSATNVFSADAIAILLND